MRAKLGYRMVTDTERKDNPIVPEGALVKNADMNYWISSNNVGNAWASMCKYCVPKDYKFDKPKKIKKVDKWVAVKKVESTTAWGLFSKDGKLIVTEVTNKAFIYKTREAARCGRFPAETVKKVTITVV
jgi:hypothetical protein